MSVHLFKVGETLYHLYCGELLCRGVVVRVVGRQDGYMPGYIVSDPFNDAKEWVGFYGALSLEEATAWRLRHEGR